MSLVEKFTNRVDFDTYEDFHANFKINVPENFNFAYDIIDEYARIEPDRPALVWCNDFGEEKFFTFADFKRESDKAANMFKNLGIKKGDKVMLILRRRYEIYFCIFALAKLGAIFIPATNMLMKKDIVYRNNAAGVKAIVAYDTNDIPMHVDSARADSPTVEKYILVGSKKEGWISYEEEMEKASDVWERPTGELNTYNEDIMLIYFTSGTSSDPKMTAHNFTYPLGHIVTAKFWHRVQDRKLHLSLAESGWAKFGWGKLYGQWICGAVQFLYDMEKFDALKVLEKIEKYKITTFCAPPTVYRFLIHEDFNNYDLSSLKAVTTAGEALNPEVYNKFRELTGLEIKDGFGQTETTILVGNFIGVETCPGSMGKPNPIYDIDIIDDDGNSCPDGVEGELVIRNYSTKHPAGITVGYYGDAAATEKVTRFGMYHTGDVVYRDEYGYFWFVGRNDDVIKASGYRISPFEVESALIEHPAVVECAVTGAPHKDRGLVVKATVVLTKGFTPSDELIKELQNHVKRVTAPYKYPRIIEFVDELPKTHSGKIKRAQIRREDNAKA